MAGSFQAENAALAALAVKSVIPEISEDAIEKGLSRASLPGRFEVIKNPSGYEKIPYLVLDGAHTVNSVKFTLETVQSVFGDAKKDLLFACAADKDAKDIAPLFKNKFDSIFLTRPGEVKQSDLTSLSKAFDSAKLSYNLSEDYESQIKKALQTASEKKSILLVTGSFYLIAEVKKGLRFKE